MEIAVQCKLLLYSDDSTLLIPGLKDTEMQLSRELSWISEWLVDNKLSLHLGKTESNLFGQKRKLKNKSLSVVCNGTKISPSSTVKYLGAELNQSLDGEEMTRNVVNMVYARIIANPNFRIQIHANCWYQHSFNVIMIMLALFGIQVWLNVQNPQTTNL